MEGAHVSPSACVSLLMWCPPSAAAGLPAGEGLCQEPLRPESGHAHGTKPFHPGTQCISLVPQSRTKPLWGDQGCVVLPYPPPSSQSPEPQSSWNPIRIILFIPHPSSLCKSLISINTSWTAWVLILPQSSNTIQLNRLLDWEIYAVCEWDCRLFLFQLNNGNKEKQMLLLK